MGDGLRVAQATRSGNHAARSAASAIEWVRARAYEIPTATECESDGTLSWNSTGLVVVQAHADGCTGLGYTYCDAAAAGVVEGKLAEIVRGADALAPAHSWSLMHVQARQLGQEGIGAMALSAVDVALHDLRARLLGVCLADALPRVHDDVSIYGSGGFTNYTHAQLREQAQGWVDEGIDKVKIKVGSDKQADPDRLEVVRSVLGADVQLMVDGNGAYEVKDALAHAEAFARQGVVYFEEPLSSKDLEGLAMVRERAPAGMEIAAGEYAWGLPDAQRMLDAHCVDIMQADVTRCGGVSGMLRIDALCRGREVPFSAHCAPAISAQVCCAMESVKHIEYFFDHVRIEEMAFEGVLSPQGGALRPDRQRPGLGLELREDGEIERYRVGSSG